MMAAFCHGYHVMDKSQSNKALNNFDKNNNHSKDIEFDREISTVSLAASVAQCCLFCTISTMVHFVQWLQSQS
jgi:hypothetical protein